jgi:hypothetical protein
MDDVCGHVSVSGTSRFVGVSKLLAGGYWRRGGGGGPVLVCAMRRVMNLSR